jgi:hypothetical protein
MVIYAHLDTNVREIISDLVDNLHQVCYKKSLIVLQDKGGRDHILDISTGKLGLYNIQAPELPIVKAIADNGVFVGDKFNPMTIPSRKELHNLPTIFELERLAKEPVIISGIARLSADGFQDDSRDSSYFKEQKAELGAFVAAYARAVSSSPLGKPVLEGFYEAIKRKNSELIADAENPALPEARRNIMRKMVYQEEDLVNVFGRDLYHQLKAVLRE